MTEEDQVFEFIHRRFPQDNNWCTGNCYWFAKILAHRFPQYLIYYLPIENHWIVGDGTKFFDWKKCYNINDLEETPYLWDAYKFEDLSLYKKLLKDCMM